MKTNKTLHSVFCLLLIEVLLISTMIPSTVWALGTSDPRVTTNGTNTTVDTGADLRAVLNWYNFDTVDGDILTFINENPSFAVLNRVMNEINAATYFDGDLIANGGHIFVINSNGIVFGPNADISAAGFVASSLNISDADFMNGYYAFSGGEGAIENYGRIQVTDPEKITALIGNSVYNAGSISSPGGVIVLASGNNIFLGSEDSDIVVHPEPADAPEDLVKSGDVVNDSTGTITNSGGHIVLAAGDTFVQAVEGLEDLGLKVEGTQGYVKQYGIISTSDGLNSAGTVTMSAVRDVQIENGSSTRAQDMNFSGRAVKIDEDLESGGDMTILADNSVIATEDLTSGGAMTIKTENRGVYVAGQIEAEDDLLIDAGTFIALDDDAESNSGSMTLRTHNDDTFILGDLYAYGNINLATNLYLGGGHWEYDEQNLQIFWEDGDQTIFSENGRLTAYGLVRKETPGDLMMFGGGGDDGLSVNLDYAGPEPVVSNGGNIFIVGYGDIMTMGDIDATVPGSLTMPDGAEAPVIKPNQMGGVLLYSETGSIYSTESDALHATIRGYSDEVMSDEPIGVPLLFLNGGTQREAAEDIWQHRAAIEIISAETLKIGEEAVLIAYGNYLPASEENPEMGVDNRPGISFLAEDAAIGGFDRDQGVASDVAIYLASMEGNIEIHSPNIYAGPRYHTLVSDPCDFDFFNLPTVVFDAYDTVLMPFFEEMNFDVGSYNYRLEVVSRITEWLSQAIDNATLPFADNPELMMNYYEDYVLRGAGDFPDYPDIRAWVLEDMTQPNPDPVVPPLATLVIPETSGCPVEMDAAAAELGISADDLQLSIGTSLAMNPNLNPCEACARLVNASRILNDESGLHLAAMNQVFNTLAPADAPFTPETAASVVTAFAELGEDNTQYALAGEYLDAFVQYVAVVGTDLQVPVGDPVALVMEKYGSSVLDSGNPNVSAFILSQLQ